MKVLAYVVYGDVAYEDVVHASDNAELIAHLVAEQLAGWSIVRIKPVLGHATCGVRPGLITATWATLDFDRWSEGQRCAFCFLGWPEQ